MYKFLLVEIPLFALVIYFIYRSFKNIDIKAKLDEQENEQKRVQMASKIDPDQIRRARKVTESKLK